MTGMHLLQGLNFSVAQGGDILHRVCSLSIGWTKAPWDTLRGSTQSSGAILSKSNWISYQNLCPGTYEHWRARVLGLPFSPAVMPPAVVDASTGFTLLIQSEILKEAFAPELQNNDRPFMATLVKDFLEQGDLEA